MKHFKQVLTVTTQEREQFLNLSFEVEECVRKSHVSEGFCVVLSQHTTSAVFLDHDDDKLSRDRLSILERLAGTESEYKVDYTSAAAAHIKQILLGSSVTVSVTNGKLDLGPRQYIMYGDFDGMREKSVIVKVIGD